MVELSIDDGVFEVVREEVIGGDEFRIVKFSEGFYGLECFVDGEWVLVLLSPDRVSGVSGGGVEYLMDNIGYVNLVGMLSFIRDAQRLYDGEFWELRLYLNDVLADEFNRVVRRSDGEDLLNSIREVNGLVSEMVLEQMESNSKWYFLLIGVNVFYWILIILLVCVR